TVAKRWSGTTNLQLELPMPVQRVHADPHVKADIGRVALQRGPIVYCLEGVDNDGHVRTTYLPADANVEIEHRSNLLGGVTLLRGKGMQVDTSDATVSPASRAKDIVAVPYYAWNNRDAGEMTVWIPESAEHADKPPLPGVTPSASHCWDS